MTPHQFTEDHMIRRWNPPEEVMETKSIKPEPKKKKEKPQEVIEEAIPDEKEK